MPKDSLATVALLVLSLSCASSNPEAQQPAPPLPSTPAPTASAPASAAASAPPATSASAAPAAAPVFDLSTAEKARVTIYEALRRGDKAAFKKSVTKRILDRQGDGFDAWFELWKGAAERGSVDSFKGVVVSQEDGSYKLDEN